MDRRLGRPLPHQLSNPTRAHPCAINLWCQNHAVPTRYAVLASVSGRYPPHKGRLLTRYSPVRHWSEDRSPRLRSTWMCYARRQRSSWARIKLSKICIISPFGVTIILPSFCSSFTFVWVVFLTLWIVEILLRTFSLLCTYLFCCSIFNDRLAAFLSSFGISLAATRPLYHIFRLLSIPFSKLFLVFSSFFLLLLSRFGSFFPPQRLVHYTTFSPSCQYLF